MAICMDHPIPFALPEPLPNSSAAVRRSIRYVTAKNRRDKAAWLDRQRELEMLNDWNEANFADYPDPPRRSRQPRRNAA